MVEPIHPAVVRAAFIDQKVKLPLRLSDEDTGVLLDDDGVDVITIDVNNTMQDEKVQLIAMMVAECVNTAAGFTRGERQ